METLFIPNEQDFRRWVRETVMECMEKLPEKIAASAAVAEDALLTRRETAALLRISVVTLHEWMKQGLPSRKQGGRVYFLRSEIMDYVKRNRRGNTAEEIDSSF